MSFKMVLLPPNVHDEWPAKIREAVPDCDVKLFAQAADAARDIQDADAAYGTVPPELFSRAGKLRWISAPAAGLGGSWYHEALVRSDVVVTNLRGIYNDHLSTHIMAFLLAFAKHLDRYMIQQQQRRWEPMPPGTYLSASTVLIIGMGGIGSETARLCAALGMTVIGVDPRVKDLPPHVAEIHQPEGLDELLGRADFVVITTPETPQTQGMMHAGRFCLMKPTAYLINVGRGACVVLDDLIEALRSNRIAGAGLDVFETEPLPADHPLWNVPNVMITPHVAARNDDPQLPQRRTALLVENCRRFARGVPLLNVVDKENWF